MKLRLFVLLSLSLMPVATAHAEWVICIPNCTGRGCCGDSPEKRQQREADAAAKAMRDEQQAVRSAQYEAQIAKRQEELARNAALSRQSDLELRKLAEMQDAAMRAKYKDCGIYGGTLNCGAAQ